MDIFAFNILQFKSTSSPVSNLTSSCVKIYTLTLSDVCVGEDETVVAEAETRNSGEKNMKHSHKILL